MDSNASSTHIEDPRTEMLLRISQLNGQIVMLKVLHPKLLAMVHKYHNLRSFGWREGIMNLKTKLLQAGVSRSCILHSAKPQSVRTGKIQSSEAHKAI